MGEFKVGIGSVGERPLSIGHDLGSKQGSGWWGGGQRSSWLPKPLGQYNISDVIITTMCGSPKVSMPATPLMPSKKKCKVGIGRKGECHVSMGHDGGMNER